MQKWYETLPLEKNSKKIFQTLHNTKGGLQSTINKPSRPSINLTWWKFLSQIEYRVTRNFCDWDNKETLRKQKPKFKQMAVIFEINQITERMKRTKNFG